MKAIFMIAVHGPIREDIFIKNWVPILFILLVMLVNRRKILFQMLQKTSHFAFLFLSVRHMDMIRQ
jgi:hypothetical protein